MEKLPKILQFAIAGLGLVFCVMILLGSDGQLLDSTGTSGLNGATTITIAAMVIGGLLAIGFGVVELISKGKRAMPTLIGIGVFVVVCLICYAGASDAIPPKVNVDASTSKLVSAGLTLFYVLLGGTFLAIVVGEIRSLFS